MKDVAVVKERIIDSLTERFEDTDFFIVEVQVTPTGNVNVFVDNLKENINIQQCVDLSRYLENYLESNELVSEKYKLEVSSPGMDEPFRVPQQYEKWTSKPVEVLLKSGIKEVGNLIAFTEEKITIEIPEKKKKKEIIPAEQKTYDFADIKYTRKHFVFK